MADVRATLTQNRKYVRCGACGRVLCRRDRMPDGQHILVWDSDWEQRGPAIARRGWRGGGAPTRRGWLGNVAGGVTRTRKSFSLSIPALCECGKTNEIDAATLDVSEVRES